MSKAKLMILIVLIFNSSKIIAQTDNKLYDEMIYKCQDFVDNYKPTYVIGLDTMVVSRFTLPPKDLNSFLFECLKNSDYRLLKYSCLIVIKQNQEYTRINHMDYLLDDQSYSQNGFIELLRTKMGLPNNEYDYIAPMYTGDICKWIKDHKKEIFDYEYIDKYLKSK